MKKNILRILAVIMFLSVMITHASCLTVEENSWLGFSMTFETSDELKAGNTITVQLTLKNQTKDNITITQMNHWYYQEWDNSETYPGVELGQLVDNDTHEIVAKDNSATSINYSAGSTKTFTYTATLPDTWNSKSQMTFVLAGTGSSGQSYWAQLDVPETKEPEENEVITIIGDAPMINFTDGNLADAVLNDDEKDDEYSYTVNLSSELINKDDVSKLVESQLDTKEIALVLDLNITKIRYDNGEEIKTPVTSLNSPLTLTIDIPEEYLVEDRVFSVLRVHDGVVEELKDLDNDPNTVTISTDKFSYYYLVYHQKEDVKVETVPTVSNNEDKTILNNQDKTVSHDTKEKAPQTGDQTNIMLYFMSMMSMFILGCLIYKKIKE